MEKVRWGVLSTAKIGVEKVIPAMQAGQRCSIVAIASRNVASAQAAAAKLGLSKAHGSYEKLLSDPDIDAVYIPLPNHLHVQWTIASLEAGKHVLCEKPIGLNVKEAERLLAAAGQHPRLKVMEAFMYRHHPQWRMAQQLVQNGEIGALRTIQSFFSYHNTNPTNIRNIAEVGGGGLMDIGCYCISLSRFIFGAEPRRVLGMVEYDPAFKTDRLASGMLEFATGDGSCSGTATFTCSTQLSPYQRVNIFGAEGASKSKSPSMLHPIGRASCGTSAGLKSASTHLIFAINMQFKAICSRRRFFVTLRSQLRWPTPSPICA